MFNSCSSTVFTFRLFGSFFFFLLLSVAQSDIFLLRRSSLSPLDCDDDDDAAGCFFAVVWLMMSFFSTYLRGAFDAMGGDRGLSDIAIVTFFGASHYGLGDQ